MSTEITVYSQNQIAIAQPQSVALVERAVSEMGVGLFDLEAIRVPGSGGTTWEVPSIEGTLALRELDLVITSIAMNQRAWYRTDADDGVSGPPDCSSRDGIHAHGNREMDGEGDTQDHEYLCADCPWSQWGSSRKGTKGQDCREFAWVIGFRPEAALPVQLSVPRTSLKSLRRYLLRLMGAGLMPENVVTRLTLLKNGAGASAYSTIEYAMAGRIDSEAGPQMARAKDATSSILALFGARRVTRGTVIADDPELH